jgi:hypothetical protein
LGPIQKKARGVLVFEVDPALVRIDQHPMHLTRQPNAFADQEMFAVLLARPTLG